MRPAALPSRSARRLTVRSPVSSTSGSCALPPSFDPTPTILQTPMPAPASVAFTDTDTACILWFGDHSVPGVAVTEAMTGAVVSRLIVTLCEDVPPADVALHVKVLPFVSLATVVVLQPFTVNGDSESVTLQETVTSDVYQPPDSVPLTVGVMTGAVVS